MIFRWAAPLGLGCMALVSALPYLWLVLTAFRPRTVITASPPDFSVYLTFENFASVYNGQSIFHLFGNSLIVSIGTVGISLLAGLPAAYYFSRNPSGWSKSLFLIVLSTRMAPPIALSLPMFVVFTEIGLRGTYVAVIIAEAIFSIAFVVWFLEGALSGVPPQAEWAAQVDGRSQLGALVTVVLPAILTALAAAAGFVFLFSWNEYMMASLLSSSATRPITPALPGFIAQATSQWGAFCAVAFMSSLPPLLMAVLARRFLTRGLTAGLIPDA